MTALPLPDSTGIVTVALAVPIDVVLSGAHGARREVSIETIHLRRPTPQTLALLDRWRGQPIALAINAAAALADLTTAQIKRLDLGDFQTVTKAALSALSEANEAMGLPAGWYLDAPREPVPVERDPRLT